MKRRLESSAVDRGVQITFVAAAGDPYHELRRVADEVRADAVVVGASTKAGHRFVGSLAVRLVKAGRWPVTVVP
jgi:nucleotide-binding universal stress UspA family protein